MKPVHPFESYTTGMLEKRDTDNSATGLAYDRSVSRKEQRKHD